MSARDTLVGIVQQWSERIGAADETPEALTDAYRDEVRREDAATVRAAKLSEALSYDDGRLNRTLERVAKKIEGGRT